MDILTVDMWSGESNYLLLKEVKTAADKNMLLSTLQNVSKSWMCQEKHKSKLYSAGVGN